MLTMVALDSATNEFRALVHWRWRLPAVELMGVRRWRGFWGQPRPFLICWSAHLSLRGPPLGVLLLLSRVFFSAAPLVPYIGERNVA